MLSQPPKTVENENPEHASIPRTRRAPRLAILAPSVQLVSTRQPSSRSDVAYADRRHPDAHAFDAATGGASRDKGKPPIANSAPIQDDRVHCLSRDARRSLHRGALTKATGYGGHHDIFRADRVWLNAVILTVGYMLSRGFAKSGSRDPYTGEH
jgi:hypothetical protein